MTDENGELGLEYEVDDRPSLLESILPRIQYVSMVIISAIAMAFIVAGAVGLGVVDTTHVAQMVLLFLGLTIVVQVYAVRPAGPRLLIMMGTSFTFVGTVVTTGIDYDLSVVFGVVLVTDFLVGGLIDRQFNRVEPFFPPLVTDSIAVIVGLYLVPVGMDYVAGGVGAADYGVTHNIGLAALVLGVVIALNLLTDGITRLLSTLVGIAAGHAVVVPLGMVDFLPITDTAWFVIPQPGTLGATFEPALIVTFAFLFLVSMIETVGDMSGIIVAEEHDPTNEKFRGGLSTGGLMSSVASVSNAFPVTSFSRSAGIVNFIGVTSHHVVGIAGVIFVVLGPSPKVGAAVATTPSAVFGGTAPLMAGTIAASGTRLVLLYTNLDRRNMVVVATPLDLGLGVATRPDALSGLPQVVAMFFGEPAIMTALTVPMLNIFASDDQNSLFDAVDESVVMDAVDGANGHASTND